VTKKSHGRGPPREDIAKDRKREPAGRTESRGRWARLKKKNGNLPPEKKKLSRGNEKKETRGKATIMGRIAPERIDESGKTNGSPRKKLPHCRKKKGEHNRETKTASRFEKGQRETS